MSCFLCIGKLVAAHENEDGLLHCELFLCGQNYTIAMWKGTMFHQLKMEARWRCSKTMNLVDGMTKGANGGDEYAPALLIFFSPSC